MSTDKMREEFERVVGEDWENSPIHLKSLWEESWKASRAVLVIKLPAYMEGPSIEDEDDDYEQFELHETVAIEVNAMRAKCLKAIEATGVKVK